MKFALLSFLVLLVGAVYANYSISVNEAQKSERFILSREDEIAESLKASILNNPSKAAEEAFGAQNEIEDLIQDIQEVQEVVEIDDVAEDIIEDLAPVEDIEIISSDIIDEAVSVDVTPVSSQVQEQGDLLLMKSLPGGAFKEWQSGKYFQFEFDHNVSLESFFSHFTLEPSTDGRFSGDMAYGASNKVIIVSPVPALTAGMNYTFKIGKGVESMNGAYTLNKDIQFSFTVK